MVADGRREDTDGHGEEKMATKGHEGHEKGEKRDTDGHGWEKRRHGWTRIGGGSGQRKALTFLAPGGMLVSGSDGGTQNSLT